MHQPRFLQKHLLIVLLLFTLGLPACHFLHPDRKAVSADPSLTDRQLLDTVQRASIAYFWTFAHPVSGMAPERTATPDTVTTGGTGFGISALVVGVSRGWLARDSVVDRLLRLTAFLERADRYHGAWSHWMNGRTGKTIPFSPKDDGGDLVETSYLINGLLIAGNYFDGSDSSESLLRRRIQHLWETVDWDWYTKGHSDTLFWHWSPDFGWAMHFPIQGFNECLITYILALSSPTHPIPAVVYRHTWVNSPHFINGNSYFGYRLNIGFPYGGPLFFTQYSFLGLNPQLMQDVYTNYWRHNVTQTLINRAYCIRAAPKDFGYSAQNWGLTASDDWEGYSAHAPDNDNGTITPSAALSAFPYTPYYSMQVLRHLFESLHDSLWGPYGFYDAFSLKHHWFSRQYLAIDEGPIPVMIENYRTGLPWKLFMEIPDIQHGLQKAGIGRPAYTSGFYLSLPEASCRCVDLLMDPDSGAYKLPYYTQNCDAVSITLTDQDGRLVRRLLQEKQPTPGRHILWFHIPAGTGDSLFRMRIDTAGILADSLMVRFHGS